VAIGALPATCNTPVSSITIQFSEPVTGFNLAALQLRRDGAGAPLTGATLTTANRRTWTLGNLSALTFYDGAHQLVLLRAARAPPTSRQSLAAGADVAWSMDAGSVRGGPGDDTFRIVCHPDDASRVDVFINSDTTPRTRRCCRRAAMERHGGDGDDSLIVDFSRGDPLPADGLIYQGEANRTGNSLAIAGTSGGDNVTVSDGQVTVNGSHPIGYGDAQFFRFELGAGSDNLTIDGETLCINQDDAISGGTSVRSPTAAHST